MEVLLVLLYTALFLGVIYTLPFFRRSGLPFPALMAAFLAKVLTGFLLYLVYTKYYTDPCTADIFKYFDDSRILYQALWHHPLDFLKMMTGVGNDTAHFSQYYQQMNNWYGIYPSNVYGDGHIMIRFNAVLRLVSFGYYNVHGVWMGFLSFLGLVGMFRVFSQYLPGRKWLLYALLFFMPSLLFWSSGVLKEGLIVFSLGIILFLLHRIRNRSFQLYEILLLLLMAVLLRYTKFYLFALLIPLASAWLLSGVWKRNTWLVYISLMALCLAIAWWIGSVLPMYNVPEILSRKQHDFLNLAQEAGAGSLIRVVPLSSSPLDFLSAMALGFFNTLTRPFPWEINSMMMIPAALENILIWGLLGICLVVRGKVQNPNLYWFSMWLWISVFAIIGMITPVTGAMVRYKAVVLPFLVVSCLMLWEKRKRPTG